MSGKTQTISYNESRDRRIRVRHIFFPGIYGLISETILALLALVWFNASNFGTQLLGQQLGTTPFAISSEPLHILLQKLDQYHALQKILLFLLWAVAGALLYIIAFRSLQAILNVRSSVATGVTLIRRDPGHGLLRWLSSLHDLFVKALLIAGGVVAIAVGSSVCFGIASQELRNGLAGSFPENLGPLALSLVAAVLSVRCIAMGVSLVSTRFRNWYTA